MTDALAPLLPAVTWLLAALLCLLLEAAGTPVGARKRGARSHLVWVLGLAGAVIVVESVVRWSAAPRGATSAGVGVVAFDRMGLLATAVIAVVVVLAHVAATPGLRRMDEERGEMSAAFAVFGAAMSVLAVATHPLSLLAALALAVVSLGVLAAPDRDGPHGIEAAAKGLVSIGFVMVLLALAAALRMAGPPALSMPADAAPAPLATSSAGLVLLALAALLGAVPLHQGRVDLGHGAASASAAMFAGALTLALGSAMSRVVEAGTLVASPSTASVCAVAAVLTLAGAPIAALDQARVGRAVAYLAVLPGGLVLAAVAAVTMSPAPTGALAAILTASVTGGLAAAAALLGVAVPSVDPASTWEDWAGFGRRHPVVAALFVYALGSLAGLPGTAGLVARLDVARASFHAGLDVLGLAVLASTALGAVPIVRLALFLFAKEPPLRAPRAKAPREASALLVAFVVLVACMIALAAWPPALDSAVAATRR